MTGKKFKGSIGRIIITLMILSITIIGGTFAWFTYRSRESALVLSIGDINDSKVIIEPYQIREELMPTNSYTDGVYSQITAINNNSNNLIMNLFYKVNQMDEVLINNGLKYTIVSSTSKDGEYTEVDTGDFTNISNNKVKIINTSVAANSTKYYRVYLWLDTNAGNQVAIQNSMLDVELNGKINHTSNTPILDEGMVPVVIYEDGTVMTTSEDNLDWYDYENQQWANMVLVENELYDLSGNNTDNTINGAVFTDKGLSFDGADDYVLLPEISLSSMSEFTFEVEFSADEIRNAFLLTNDNSGGGEFKITGGGKIQIGLYNSSTLSYDVLASTEIIEVGKTYLATGIYDGNNITLYVNGEYVNSLEFSGPIGEPTNNTHFALGCNPSGTTCQGSYFDGIIKSARIYNKALTAEEISNNYNGDKVESNLLFDFDTTVSKRSYYKNNAEKEVIESDILAYYVWIPRYKYKIWTTGVSAAGQEQPIDIVFESMNDEMSLGTAVGKYRTHPAFWWDNDSDGVQEAGEMLPGIWIGKFETSGDATTPTVKPNVVSLTSQNISTQFSTSLKFAGGSMNLSTGEVSFTGNDTYGLTEITDSHMMKNSEWGAVAYLSHSQYGINEELRINNYYASSKTLTGCGAASANAATSTTCGIPYGKPSTEENTYPQSTTGNITGVFDISGGATEMIMGNYNKTAGSSGFSIFPENKYYDLYTATDISTTCDGGICYGHALSESNNWYSDINKFLTTSNVWLYRGSDNSMTSDTGAFAFGSLTGVANAYWGHRSVLIPNMNYTVNFDANGGSLVDISYTTVGEHEFIAPIDGEYKLEVWGAQGGSINSTYRGGYGGYSVGNIVLTPNTTLYVNVGGAGSGGSVSVNYSGGYNGGGSNTGASSNRYISSGGGATHIATTSGELKTLSPDNDLHKILIVGGGGGGGYKHTGGEYYGIGGSGGGFKGANGSASNGGNYGIGGSQTLAGYANGMSTTGVGGFGYGGNNGSGGHGSAGGGGYYGGGGSGGVSSQSNSSGGGGSGYISNTLLTDKYMYCYNCTTSSDESTLTYTTTNVSADAISNYAKSGDGAARIRQLSDKDITYGYKYGSMPIPTRDGYVFAGWYTKPEGGTKVNENDIVNVMNNHTLYARWAVVDLNINYSVNGGTITSSTTSSDGNTTYNWTTNVDKIYLNGELYTSNISGTQTINLPNYNDSNFININKGGSGVQEGEEWICLSGCKKDNMIFSQDVEYNISDFCDGSNDECNIVLGVNFLKAYKIIYDANGGYGEIESQIKYHGVPINLTSLIPSNAKYAFAGWSTDKDATTASYLPGSEFGINSDITLYAVWINFKPFESYSCANGSLGSEPYAITYTGNCTVIDDGNGNWRVKFLTSGTFTSAAKLVIDTFLVGGGGGGGSGYLAGTNFFGGGGGGGGYTLTRTTVIESGKSYEIVIGAGGAPSSAGGNTTAFDFSASGGGGGSSINGGTGGSGGGGGGFVERRGGYGGSNGGVGIMATVSNGIGGGGQGTNTYEFKDTSLTLYSGGGGGGGGGNGDYNGVPGSGGSGGGAGGNGGSAGNNTGGGGGGGRENNSGGRGGSGIVVIRNTRSTCSSEYIPNDAFDFTYTGDCEVIDDGSGNWRIKFLTDGIFKTNADLSLDVFLVGGGGGGGGGMNASANAYGGGGGGGGHVINSTVSIVNNIEYQIIIGRGGSSGTAGGNTSGFEKTALGGSAGSGVNGGSGGSGGGGGTFGSHVAGNGGSNGASGAASSTYSRGGSGGGISTYEFGDSSLTLYSGGGGGGAGGSENSPYYGTAGSGGTGGGAKGGRNSVGASAAENTGGGGGGYGTASANGSAGPGGRGGSGIVVIRNKR